MRSEPHQSCKGYKTQSKRFLFSRYLWASLEGWTQCSNVLFLVAKPMEDAAHLSFFSQALLSGFVFCHFPLISHTQSELVHELKSTAHTSTHLWDKAKDKSKYNQTPNSREGRYILNSDKEGRLPLVLLVWLELEETEGNRMHRLQRTDACTEDLRTEYECEFGKGVGE